MGEGASRVVVLDDDPTGSQAASAVRVLLRPDLEATRRWLNSPEHALYVVTNTRSMSESDTVSLIGGYVNGLRVQAAELGYRVTLVLRGDSTLRGHVRAEIDCVAERSSLAVFVPAFPDGGRVTIGGTHYVRDRDGSVPVAETEFARDPVFGYRDSYLPAWLASHAPGRPVRTIGLATIRRGAAAVASALRDTADGTVVVPDAETREDIDMIVAAIRSVEATGRSVVLRGAATVAAARAGVSSIGLLNRTAKAPVRTLVVCGSHTAASTRQLAVVQQRTGTDPVELPAVAELPSAEETEAAARVLVGALDRGNVAVLSSARARPAELATLADGASMMRRLTAVAAAVSDRVDACVVKGGITSADIGATSFDAVEATVVGQLEAGVSLWRLNTRGRQIDYVVVPGNMGDDRTLLRSLAAVTMLPSSDGSAT